MTAIALGVEPAARRRSILALQIVVAIFAALRLYMHLAGDNDSVAAIAYLRARFATLTLLERVPILRFGRTIHTFQIYLGEGYAEPK